MPSELPQHLREIAQFQQGILTRRQAQQSGLTKDLIRSRVRQDRWQRMHAGVYAVFSGEPGRAAVLWAAVLRAGPGALLSYQTAAELATLTDLPSTLIHVTIPASRRITKIPGIVVHVSDRAQQMRHGVLSPARTRVEETVLDLTQLATTAETAYGWITRALGRRLTTQARLRDAMALRSRLRWRCDLAAALAPGWDGVHSGLEHKLSA
jgi:predicted transcriptional regulator of viral defense system